MHKGVYVMSRAYNFSAGPAALPEEVLLQAQQEMLDWHTQGLSIMEMSHRGKIFVSIAQEAEQDLRQLLGINNDYAVLFLQGGASAQFSMIPMNLLGDKKQADYINTGIWSKKAIKEAERYATINIAASAETNDFKAIPSQEELQLNPNAAYVHYTPNETIGGLAYNYIPETGDIPLVADFSSSILSEPLEVTKFGLIYAGAQKNIGPAGLTVVIVRKDLLDKVIPCTPGLFNYKNQIDADSMLNTPPTYGWYLSGLVFKWLKSQGGLETMAQKNRNKANKLYSFIDNSDFYTNSISIPNRSLMNIPFTLADERLDSDFIVQAEQANLLNLKGHRSVGGMRASIYNAVPEEAVDVLIDFMRTFEKYHA